MTQDNSIGSDRVAYSDDQIVVKRRPFTVRGKRFEQSVVELKASRIVAVVPVLGNGVLLEKHYRPSLGMKIIEIPAGRVDPKETVARGAVREVQEETGYSVKSLARLGEMYLEPKFSNVVVEIYRAELGALSGKKLQSDEVLEVFVSSRAEIRRMMRKGLIKDPKTVFGIFLESGFKKRGK